MLRHTVTMSLVSLTCLASSIQVPEIPLPVIPQRDFKITDYGAVSDGKTLNTSVIAKTIAACKAAGGGRVVVPAGEFLTGPIEFVSRMALHLEKGAVLRFSDDPALYGRSKSAARPDDDEGAGGSAAGEKAPIDGKDLSDFAITGFGTLDGNGKAWLDEINTAAAK